MNCPFCTHKNTRVVNSRPAHKSVMRRRECVFCHQRFTTMESIDTLKLNGELRAAPLDAVEAAYQEYWADGCG